MVKGFWIYVVSAWILQAEMCCLEIANRQTLENLRGFRKTGFELLALTHLFVAWLGNEEFCSRHYT